MIMRKPISPMEARKSQYGIDPSLVKKRGAELPNIVSLTLKELFPDTPTIIYPTKQGKEAIRKSTIKALEKVKIDMIKKSDSVNILASHHGFTLVGGEAYAEMLRTIRDEIEKRTGTSNIRLRAGVGLRFRETEEYIKRFKLDEHFKGKAKGIAPVDEGIAIETEIGTLYGIKAAYDADWIVHAHNSDVREVHFHRQIDRAVKSFAMSYARIETRSTYHQNLGPRAANFVARSIFNSKFVQDKFAFTTFLVMSPGGVVGIDADNSLYSLNDRITAVGMKYYGKIFTLLGTIDECITILDFPCPAVYVFSAGVIFANFMGVNVDLFDLDNSLPPYTWYTEAFYGKNAKPLIKEIPPLNKAIKVIVHNYAWGGYPSAFCTEHIPTIIVRREQADLLSRDPQNLKYASHAVIADTLDSAMEFAQKITEIDKIIIFDGAVGGLNVSKSLAETLIKNAPEVSEKVDNILLPKWFKQRNIDLSILKKLN